MTGDKRRVDRVSPGWRWLLLGAVVALGLGMATHYLSVPGIGGVLGLLPLAGELVLLALSLLLAVRKRSIKPLAATAALLVAFTLGVRFGPDGPGSIQERPGTGWASARDDPDVIWSGPVICRWTQGGGRTINNVSGFEVPVTDPVVLAANDLVSATIWSVTLPPDEGWVGDDPYGAIVDVTAKRRADGPWPAFGADLEDLSSNGASGTAVSADAGVVLWWKCVAGP
jgi:hypothetical protein